MTNKDKVIYELWRILDNIDTMGDIAKSDNAYYRRRVVELQNKRWDVIGELDIDELYEKYRPE